LSVALHQLGVPPETQVGVWRAVFRLRQAINELEHAAESIHRSGTGEDACLEALQTAQQALYQAQRCVFG
jgi:hypothetical protein